MLKTKITNEELQAIKKPLKQAFQLLCKKHNLAARMNFSCCGNCGSSEMNEIVEEKKKAGYIFYHNQDEDSFKERGEVHIRYGAANNGELTDKAIGHLIVAACKEFGLQTKWNGEITQCILIKGFKYLEQWRVEKARLDVIHYLHNHIAERNINLVRLTARCDGIKKEIVEYQRQLDIAEKENKNETK